MVCTSILTSVSIAADAQIAHTFPSHSFRLWCSLISCRKPSPAPRHDCCRGDVETAQCFARHVTVSLALVVDKLMIRVLFAHFCLMGAMKKYHEQITTTGRFRPIDKELAVKAKVPLKPTDWVGPLFLWL